MGALSASMAVPRPISEPSLSPPPDRAVPDRLDCGLSLVPRMPGDGRQRLVHARLASRIPALPELDRIRLAATVLEEAQAAGLDPLFVLAVIEVESGYDPGALSERGARGLMQLRPSTLRHEAARSNLLGDDPSDPVLNVKAGVRYYQRLLRVFGSQDLALMAYNAGPNRIIGYLRSGGVPGRFQAYPRRVHAEFRRLRKMLAVESPAVVAAREGGLVVE
jgi:soluble lytic murein transglycosylase-like protein